MKVAAGSGNAGAETYLSGAPALILLNRSRWDPEQPAAELKRGEVTTRNEVADVVPISILTE
jgi:hypothetical protein